MVQGTFSSTRHIIGFIDGATSDTATAVVANQYLRLWGGAPFNGKIGGIQAYGRTVGTGVGSTVIDVLINGTSIWPIHPTNRPTLAVGSTGQFTSQTPESPTFKQGDYIDIRVVTIPSITGHAGVSCVVTLEAPTGSNVQ